MLMVISSNVSENACLFRWKEGSIKNFNHFASLLVIFGEKMEEDLGYMHVELDGRFCTVRTKESNLGRRNS